jgi:hypothetical protein
MKFLFASLKALKKGIGSGEGSGTVGQRYRSADLDKDPDSHKNVTDPQQYFYPVQTFHTS